MPKSSHPIAAAKHFAESIQDRDHDQEQHADAAPQHDPTSLFARQVLDLYADALRDVRFPDLDRALLEDARQALLRSQVEVERVEAELHDARAALEAKAEALHAKAERALAYARVFAAGDAELSAKLAEIGVRKKPPVMAVAAADGAASPVKKRGRPKHSESDPTVTELFVADEAPSSLQPTAADDASRSAHST